MSVERIQKAERIKRELEATGIGFTRPGEVPWLVTPDKHFVTAEEFGRIEEVVDDCYVLLVAVDTAIRTGDPVGRQMIEEFGGSALRVELSRMESGYQSPVPMVRPDFHWAHNGDPTVVEIETMIGGLGMVRALRHVYGHGSFLGTCAAYAQMVRTLHAEFTHEEESDRDLRVVVVNPVHKQGYDFEFNVFAAGLEKEGINLHVARPDQVTITSTGKVLIDGQSIDVMHRFFRLIELEHDYPLTLPSFVRLARERLVCLVQPWREMLEEKAIFAYLHREDLKDYWTQKLGVDTYVRLLAVMPRTWILSPAFAQTALFRSIYQSGAVTRPFWVKKSGDSWGGRETHFGPKFGTGKWQGLLRSAIDSYTSGRVFILQEHRASRQEVFHYLNKGAMETRAMSLRISPMAFNASGPMQVHDLLTTARADAKVHGATNAVMVPSFIGG